MQLPRATPADFVDSPPELRPAEYFRIVHDPRLRARLLGSGMARSLQMPRGRQKTAPIVQLYPGLNGRTVAPRRDLPTVEALRSLVARITATEIAIERERAGDLDARILSVRRSVQAAEGTVLERAVDHLRELLEQRRQLKQAARIEAFDRIAADEGFAARAFLRLLATTPSR